MLKEFATVAAYSASAIFGRDVYRSTKNGNSLIWLGIAAFMSIAGFRMIGAGYLLILWQVGGTRIACCG